MKKRTAILVSCAVMFVVLCAYAFLYERPPEMAEKKNLIQLEHLVLSLKKDLAEITQEVYRNHFHFIGLLDQEIADVESGRSNPPTFETFVSNAAFALSKGAPKEMIDTRLDVAISLSKKGRTVSLLLNELLEKGGKEVVWLHIKQLAQTYSNIKLPR